MRKNYFSALALIFFCFWSNLASGQSVPEKPTAILGRIIVRDVAYSPDGKLLATAVSDGIHLHETGGMNEVSLLICPGEAWCIAFSPNGKWLASTCIFDKTVQLWDMATKRQVGTPSGHKGQIWSLAFNPDSRILASGSADGTIRLWDAESRQQTGLLEGHTDEVYPVAFSRDGRLLASGGKDNTVRIWDVQGQKQLKLLRGHNGWVHSLAFSPDGTMLASGGGAGDLKIRLWDVESGNQASMIDGVAYCLAFSPDGKLLASGGQYSIRVWDVGSWKLPKFLRGHTGTVYSLAFSPDGKLLASAGGDDNTVRIWDVKPQLMRTLRYGTTLSIAFSPDGNLMASGGSNAIHLWNLNSKKQVGLLQGQLGEVISVALSPDGKKLASGGDALCLWDVKSSQQIAELKGKANCVAFSPNGKTLASASGNTIYLWDAETLKQVGILQGHTGQVNSLAFSPSGNLIASAEAEMLILVAPSHIASQQLTPSIRLWDLSTQKQVGIINANLLFDVWKPIPLDRIITFSPDGTLLAWVNREGIHLWDIKTQREASLLRKPAYSVAFSPQRGMFPFLIASGDYKITRLWNLYTMKEVGVLDGSYTVAFSPDGQWLAACCRVEAWGEMQSGIRL